MYYRRILDLKTLSQKKSLLLLGPRSTGKSSLLKEQFKNNVIYINLLDSRQYLPLSAEPASIEERIGNQKSLMIIDEIQRVPDLLNEVHRLIEDKKIKFILTGSSARKLKGGKANLLAGRAWLTYLFPLCRIEITDFKLEKYLRYGGLPQVYTSSDPEEELASYVSTYIEEEIKSEGYIRKIPPFTRFLKTAALSSGELINFESIGRDAQVSASTIKEYFHILEDTMIGYLVEPWLGSKKRKAISTAKFYFFDCGVTNFISGIKEIDPESNIYGYRFEQFIANELRAYLSYSRINEKLFFWRSKSQFEVDFIIGDVAIEIKSTKRVNANHTKGLMALMDEKKHSKYYLVSHDPLEKLTDGINAIHWEKFLDKLWSGKIIQK